MEVAIYALCEPTTQLVRYVGRSSRPSERLRQHLREAADPRRQYYKCRWIRSLSEAPTLRILDWVERDGAVAAEGYWIRRLTRGGCRLVNTGTETQGLWDVRAWSAPRPPKTPEHLAKISAALKGRVNGPLSAETRTKLSAALKGRKKSSETIERMRQARRGEGAASAKLTEVQVREIKRRLLLGDVTQTELAREFNVNPSAISYVKTGRCWSHVEGGQ